MPASGQLVRGAPNELVDLMPSSPRMGTDLSNGKGVAAAHAASLGKQGSELGPASLRYLAFALAFLRFFDFFASSAGSPRSRAYLAMNSSVCSRASESGRWLWGDFIR